MKNAHCLLVVLILAALAISPCWSDDNGQAAKAASTESARPLLNSERIKQKYGSYGIDVLQDDGAVRISSLYSFQNGQKVTRTLAVVVYAPSIPASIQQQHKNIIAGGSVGEVFARSGWLVEKENLYVGEISASADFDEIYALMGESGEVDLAVNIYKLSVCKGGTCVAYATISEVHHPDYLGLSDLREIYGGSKAAGEPGAKKERDVQHALDLTLAALAAP